MKLKKTIFEIIELKLPYTIKLAWGVWEVVTP